MQKQQQATFKATRRWPRTLVILAVVRRTGKTYNLINLHIWLSISGCAHLPTFQGYPLESLMVLIPGDFWTDDYSGSARQYHEIV
jgi:hypothetical protein